MAHTNAGKISKSINAFRKLLELEGDENLIEVFDEWEVQFANYSSKNDRNELVLGETKELRTKFFKDASSLGTDARLRNIVHEFRHLLPDNTRLKSFTEFVNLPHDERSIEIDADKWARDFIIRNRRKRDKR